MSEVLGRSGGDPVIVAQADFSALPGLCMCVYVRVCV